MGGRLRRGETRFERLYPFVLPALPSVYLRARRAALKSCPNPALVLDAGGRTSHYTASLGETTIISELPRVSDLATTRHLGANSEVVVKARSRRSDLAGYVYGDMTAAAFRSNAFDLTLSIEVLEHVDDDDSFVREVARVLKPSGVFVMSTPNGDHFPTPFPAHVRHYTREQLLGLLSKHFASVDVWYADRTGAMRTYGLASWSAHHPLVTARSIVGNLYTNVVGLLPSERANAAVTAKLLAVARQPVG